MINFDLQRFNRSANFKDIKYYIDTTPEAVETWVEICYEDVDTVADPEMKQGFISCGNGAGYTDRNGYRETVTFSVDRNFNDAGHDYIASLLRATGTDAKTNFKITDTINGIEILYNDATVNVTKIYGGGGATENNRLEFEIHANGEPVEQVIP